MNKDYLSKGEINSEISTIKYLEGNKMTADLSFGCELMIFGTDKDHLMDEVDHQLDALFDVVNAFADVEGDKKWITFRKFFIALGFEIAFDFSEEAKTINIPYKDTIGNYAKSFGLEKELDRF